MRKEAYLIAFGLFWIMSFANIYMIQLLAGALVCGAKWIWFDNKQVYVQYNAREGART